MDRLFLRSPLPGDSVEFVVTRVDAKPFNLKTLRCSSPAVEVTAQEASDRIKVRVIFRKKDSGRQIDFFNVEVDLLDAEGQESIKVPVSILYSMEKSS